MESVKDVPGIKGRPCTGLDTIAAAIGAATSDAVWPKRLPGRQTAFAGPLKLHGNSKHPEHARVLGGACGASVTGLRVRRAELSPPLPASDVGT